MVNKVIEINLDLKKVVAQNTQMPPLVVGDNGNKFIITLTDDGAPVNLEDTKVLFVVSKTSDGTTVEQDTEDAIVSLDDYGISVTGTPDEGDKVTVILSGDTAVASHSGTGITGATVVSATFKAKVIDDGTYVFEFNGDDWQLGENSVIISGTNHNIVTIHLRTSSFGSGKNNCELQVYSGDDRDVLVTTAQFNFDGRPGIINDETIKTEDKYPLLTQLINIVTKLYEALKSWIGVTASATRTEGSVSVSLTEVSGHKHFGFLIPTDVHIGTSAPTGQQSVWINPDGVASEYVPTSRKINGYDLSVDRTINDSDVPSVNPSITVRQHQQAQDSAISLLETNLSLLETNLGRESEGMYIPGDERTTVFNSDGSITTTYESGGKVITVFNADGSITDTEYNSSNVAIRYKTTTFNADGSISEVIEDIIR